jgi:hypothetical protein
VTFQTSPKAPFPIGFLFSLMKSYLLHSLSNPSSTVGDNINNLFCTSFKIGSPGTNSIIFLSKISCSFEFVICG